MSVTSDRDNTTDRNLPPGAIPGRYGGYLTPWKPGERGNPEGKRGDEYLACMRICRQRSPEAADKVSELMRTSSDERIQFMAATWLVERAFGKAKEYDPKADTNSGLRFDINALTPEERSMLLAIIRRGAVRQADADAAPPETVDAEPVTQPEPPPAAPTAPKRQRRK